MLNRVNLKHAINTLNIEKSSRRPSVPTRSLAFRWKAHEANEEFKKYAKCFKNCAKALKLDHRPKSTIKNVCNLSFNATIGTVNVVLKATIHTIHGLFGAIIHPSLVLKQESNKSNQSQSNFSSTAKKIAEKREKREQDSSSQSSSHQEENNRSPSQDVSSLKNKLHSPGEDQGESEESEQDSSSQSSSRQEEDNPPPSQDISTLIINNLHSPVEDQGKSEESEQDSSSQSSSHHEEDHRSPSQDVSSLKINKLHSPVEDKGRSEESEQDSSSQSSSHQEEDHQSPSQDISSLHSPVEDQERSAESEQDSTSKSSLYLEEDSQDASSLKSLSQSIEESEACNSPYLTIHESDIKPILENLKLSEKEQEKTSHFDSIQKHIKDSGLNWKEYIQFLQATDITTFYTLFKTSIIKKELNTALEFLSFMDLDAFTGQFHDLTNKDHVVLKFNGEEIHLSKRFLAMVSPYFASMFSGSYWEENSQAIEINELDITDFKELLSILLFKQDLQIEEDNLEKFLFLSGLFQLDAIKQKCVDWIVRNINDMSAVNIAEYFNKYGVIKENAIQGKVETILQGTYSSEAMEDLKLLLPLLKELTLEREIEPAFYCCFALMENVQTLSLVIIKNDIAEHLESLKKLQVLKVNFYGRSENLKLLERLPQLHTLNIDTRKVKDDEFAFLASHKHLKVLRLKHCPITGTGLTHLACPDELEELFLGYEVTNEALALVSNFTKLRKIGIFNADKIDVNGLKDLAKLTQLIDVSIEDCQIKDEDIAFLSHLSNLKSLSLYGCRLITNQGLSYIENLPNLEKLFLRYTSVTKKFHTYVAKMTHLSEIDFCKTKVKENGLKRFLEMPNLKKIHLQGRSGMVQRYSVKDVRLQLLKQQGQKKQF